MDIWRMLFSDLPIGTVMPIAILMVENEEDRLFLEELYLKYRNLVYVIALEYFEGEDADLDDAVSNAIERICRYCSTIKGLPERAQKAYIVSVSENACRDLLRKRNKWRKMLDYSFDQSDLEMIPDERDPYETIFELGTVMELKKAFEKLRERDSELIRMHHVDGISIRAIAEDMGISENAVKIALFRARGNMLRLLKKQEV